MFLVKSIAGATADCASSVHPRSFWEVNTRVTALRIISAFLLLCSGAYATTYYVSTSGSNGSNGTSTTTAWQTINYAVNYSGLTGGDVVYIRGGTFRERVVMTRSGSATNNITISNYDGETPIIDGSGIGSPGIPHSGLFEVRSSNVTVNGLKVINARHDLDATGIVVMGPGVSHVTVQHCVTYNTSSSGIAIWGMTSDYSGATDIIIQYNDISQAVCGGYQENLTIAAGVDNYIIRYNTVHDCATAPHEVNIPLGIDSKVNVRNGKVHGNTIYSLSYASGIYVDGWDNTAYNIDIYDNVIHNMGHSGITVGAEEAGSVYNVNVYNNVVYSNAEHGIAIHGSNISTPNNIHDIHVYNNTVYGNGYNAASIYNSAARNIVFKNNIFSQNGWSNSVVVYSGNKANADVSNNVCDGVQNAFWAGTECVIGQGSISASPSFVDAGGANFRLSAGSPAINAATTSLVPPLDIDGNPRPTDGGYEIGAYEFGVAVVPAAQGPYGGAARAIPGTIQAEDYDVGGDGVAFHDLTSGNELGAYRTDNVDIEATTDVDGGHQIGHTGNGEWLEYTVHVAATGTYTLDTRVASAEAMQFHIYVDGTDVATIDAAATGADWSTWATVSKTGIALTAGQHVIRFAFTSLGFCLNWLRFTESATIQSYFRGTPASAVVGNAVYYSLNGRQLTRTNTRESSRLGIVIHRSTINGRLVARTVLVQR